MENQNERVLAYALATTIENDELENVSGGGGAQMTSRQTVKASAHGGPSADVFYDVTCDW